MPGIAAMPSSGSFPQPHLNGSNSTRLHDGLTVSEIKERTKDYVTKQSKGASAISLINAAKSQSNVAQTLENEGDLKGAMAALIAAGCLMRMFMDSSELKAEGRKGVLWNAFSEFQEREGKALLPRADHIEAKLKEFEKAKSSTTHPTHPSGGSISEPGASIRDRLQALGDSGMNVSTAKGQWSSRDSHGSSQHQKQTQRNHRNSISAAPSAPRSSDSSTMHPINGTHGTSTNSHTLIPASSFGPPSPLSSPPSSPGSSQFDVSSQLGQSSSSRNAFSSLFANSSKSPPPNSFDRDLVQFSQAFPSIDEFEELNALNLPSVPAIAPGANTNKANGQKTGGSSNGSDGGTGQSFPIPPVNLGQRPSSTPITPTVNTFVSRPASPETTRPNGRSGAPEKISDDRPPLPSGTVTPSALYAILSPSAANPKIRTLLLDVRTRAVFEFEHIRVRGQGSSGTICLEPSILLRDSVTAASIEDALSVAPREDLTLFQNRDKFDLVVVYDQSSESLENPFAIPTFPPISSSASRPTQTASKTALGALISAISTDGRSPFAKALRSPPILLVGGIDAWKREVGNVGLAKWGDSDPSESVMISTITERAQPPPTTAAAPASGQPFTSGASANAPPPPTSMPYEFWTPSSRSDAAPMFTIRDIAPSRFFSDSGESSSRPAPASANGMANGTGYPADRRVLPSRPGLTNHVSSPLTYPRSTLMDNVSSPAPHYMNGSTPHSIQYPVANPAASASTSSFTSTSGSFGPVSLPPQASINTTPLRRRSDYVDETLPAIMSRASIDYPDLSSRHVIRPPPAAASPSLERQDNRPRLPGRANSVSVSGPRTMSKPPTIQSDYPVTYWSDLQIGTAGLKNLGNTCYMNATIQCLSATVPFARFFTEGRWKAAVNLVNPLGTKGGLAQGFASILHELWHGEIAYMAPYSFRKTICNYAAQFGGSDQHDSQEFLTFLLDGLHEDLNRVLHKPHHETTPEREAELEKLPQQIASEQEWTIYRMRNNSLIVDFFQGQFRNRLECLTCHKTSTTYNSFMYLTLPVPPGKGSTRVSLEQCLNNFVREEVMEKAEAWHCPNCRVLRAATKKLSLSRLPPVLLIHLKRFQAKGPFTDKIETFVDFPLKGLDLTNYMPPPLPPGVDKSHVNAGNPLSLDDPRSQLPPYRYDLYSVTNHYGSLSSGHYTAFISSRGGWLYCDDSSVKQTGAKEVVSRAAYVLYYKRTKT